MGNPNKWEIRESGVCSGQGPAGLWGPNVRLPSPEVKGLPSWPRAQADGPPCTSVLYLCWLTQGLMGHLNATLLAFSTVTLRAGTRCDPLMLCFPLTPRREKRKWFSLAMLSSQDISLWASRIFGISVTFSYDLGRRWVTWNQFLQLLDSSGLSQVCLDLFP